MNLNNFSNFNTDKRGNLLSVELEKFKLFKVKRFFLISFKKTRIYVEIMLIKSVSNFFYV